MSNGLIPAEKKSEESLKTQNGLLEKYLGTMKALGEEGKKAKQQQEKDYSSCTSQTNSSCASETSSRT